MNARTLVRSLFAGRGSRPARWLTLAAAAALVANGVVAGAGAATPGPSAGRSLSVKSVLSGGDASRVNGAKSPTSRLARTDPELLNLSSADPVNVVVKLDYDAIATYSGGVAGYAATSPEATGRKIDSKSREVRRYATYARGIEDGFVADLARSVPSAIVGRHLSTVYGGVAVRLPGNQVETVLRLHNVVAVQSDALNQPLTDSSPAFIGAGRIYDDLGSDETAGSGVIVGVLDTGAWPEHASYADDTLLPAPPPKADATPRVCDFGDNPLTPATDVFTCNKKLISGEPFLDTYNLAYPGTELYPDSARDSDGHGTHTSTTAAGGPVDVTSLYGIDRGPIHGIAPGAHVAVYKVCGPLGCTSSDSAAAVGQAILDGVDVINYSISGGTIPFTDPVELAFLDAYAAGVFVAASAGNDGPAASTTNHLAPWVTTVAASTQTRSFTSTLTLVDGLDSAEVVGASMTDGIAVATPVVLAETTVGYTDALCGSPADPGTFTGKIVVCERGWNARVDKGYNVLQGGAEGMILYNPSVADVETDNHWLPAVHLDGPEGTTVLAFLAAHPTATATFTDSTKTTAAGDVMAAFSSRGPAGDWIKPDVTAPGVQILAGNTPTPDPAETALGPDGTYFQAIAGTSMSSPHTAGAAALIKALHPTWKPGQIKSALMTTARTDVVKEDGVTPADMFDFGSGRINLRQAGNPGLVLNETVAHYTEASGDAIHRVDLNVPSINVSEMPGSVETTRRFTNVSGRRLSYAAHTTSPAGTSITVTPSTFRIDSGQSIRLTVQIDAATAPNGQYLGSIVLDEIRSHRDLHLPVAFVHRQGDVRMRLTCSKDTITLLSERMTCTTKATNRSFAGVDVSLRTTVGRRLLMTGIDGAHGDGPRSARVSRRLTAKQPGEPSIAPGSLTGFDSLAGYGVPADAIGDEESIDYDLPAPVIFTGESYSTLGVVSNGYVVPGGADVADISFDPQTLPDPAAPNNVLAPFWSDLDGSAAAGVRVAELCDGSISPDCWIVIEWEVNVYGGDASDPRIFQLWMGENGTEDITFAYDPTNLPADPPIPRGLTVGAENSNGSAGDQVSGSVTEDYRVTSVPGEPGGSYSYKIRAKGVRLGGTGVTSTMTSPSVVGTTIDTAKIRVVR